MSGTLPLQTLASRSSESTSEYSLNEPPHLAYSGVNANSDASLSSFAATFAAAALASASLSSSGLPSQNLLGESTGISQPISLESNKEGISKYSDQTDGENQQQSHSVDPLPKSETHSTRPSGIGHDRERDGTVMKKMSKSSESDNDRLNRKRLESAKNVGNAFRFVLSWFFMDGDILSYLFFSFSFVLCFFFLFGCLITFRNLYILFPPS